MITTILLLVSRDDFLFKVISSIELLDCDASRTNILCVVDGNEKLFLKVRNLIQDTKFNNKLTVKYNNLKPIKQYDIDYRRKRIADIHKYAQTFINECNQVLLVEDDTIIPKNSLIKLLHIKDSHPSFGMGIGVELSRQAKCVGAWKFDDIYNPTLFYSLDRQKSGIDYIDAGGFYCSLVKFELYRDFDFALFENLGPDISFGLWARKSGYENFIDWSIDCRHLYLEKGVEKELNKNSPSINITMERKNNQNWTIKY